MPPSSWTGRDPLDSRSAGVRVRVWGDDGNESPGASRSRSKPACSTPRLDGGVDHTRTDDPMTPDGRRRSSVARSTCRTRDRAGPAVRDVRRRPPHPSQRQRRRRPRAGARLVELREPPPLRHPRRHLAGRRRRQRARRGRRRRVVARVPQVGHAAQRLRRAARPVRATRDHLRRRHHRRDRHRRAMAHDDRPIPRRRPLPRGDLRRSARTRRMGPNRASTTTRGSRRNVRAGGRCAGRSPGPPVRRIEELAVREVLTTPVGCDRARLRPEPRRARPLHRRRRGGHGHHAAPRRGARTR